MINKSLDSTIRELRKAGLKKFKGKGIPSAWKEKDFLDRPVDAGVVILPTRGCSWGRRSGCSMCGYVYDSTRERTSGNEILRQFGNAISRLDDIEYLKIFNSGSFFDEKEMPHTTIRRLFEHINDIGVRRVQVESRPEFLKPEVLEGVRNALDAELEIGIGLETASDYIRKDCINKGFSFEDFKKAVEVCRGSGVETKVYLLIKPPFLSEREALEDAIDSAIAVNKLGVSRISFNPVNVQRGTLVEYLWLRGEYRPPWLWTVVEVLREVKGRVKTPVLSHPSGAGGRRGAHNCGRCDSDVYKSIIAFSTSQDLKHLDRDCECRDVWREYMEMEEFDHGLPWDMSLRY